MKSFQEQVAEELKRARDGHPTPMHSAHEAYGVIFEEVHVSKSVGRFELDSSGRIGERDGIRGVSGDEGTDER